MHRPLHHTNNTNSNTNVCIPIHNTFDHSKVFSNTGLFAKAPNKRDDILQKRPINLSAYLYDTVHHSKVLSNTFILLYK